MVNTALQAVNTTLYLQPCKYKVIWADNQNDEEGYKDIMSIYNSMLIFPAAEENDTPPDYQALRCLVLKV